MSELVLECKLFRICYNLCISGQFLTFFDGYLLGVTKKFHKCQVFAVKVIYYIESIETGKNIALNVKK